MDETKKVFKDGSSLIERVMDFRYFTLLLTMVFSADIFCLILYKKNILDTLSYQNLKNIDYIHLGIYIVLFGFLMTMYFPILRYICKSLFLLISKTNIEKCKGCKYIFSARNDAIKARSGFELSLVEKKEQENKENEKELNISFSLGALVFTDFLIGKQSIFNCLYNLIQQEAGISYLIYCSMCIVFIAFISIWFYASLQPHQLETIYLPDIEEENGKKEKTK